MGIHDFVTRLLRPKEEKSSMAGSLIAWSNVGRPKWTPRRYENLAEEGYRKNVVAYRCVNMISTAAASVPWLLYDGEGAEMDAHPLADLLRHPNPAQDGVAFMEEIYSALQISGNAYVEAVRPSDAAKPAEMYVLRSDRMKVIPGPAGLPQGYEYSTGGRAVRWAADPVSGESNILHVKAFHPLDDWYGMAPLEAAMLSVDQHNAAGAWNQALLNQGARPSGALVFSPTAGNSTLSGDQVARLREDMDRLYQGRGNAGRPLILEGGLDWREMSLSPKDMDWLAGRDAAARDIALAFGVPAQLIGIQGAQTYANMAEARLALYEETVLPLVTRAIAAFDHWLSPMFDDSLRIDYDADAISALSSRRDALYGKLQGVDFLSVNEKREALGYSPIDGGNGLKAKSSPIVRK